MAVYNLGMLPERRPSVLGGLSEALMKYGMQSKLQKEEIAGKKEIAIAEREAEAKTFLAKTELEKKQKTQQYSMGLWQNASDKPESERSLWVETDTGKEFLKWQKGINPELFDAGGKPIWFPSTKDMIKQEIDAKINVVKNKLLTSGSGSLDEGERATLQMEGFKDEYSEVVANVIRNPGFQYMKPEEQQQMIKQGMELMKGRTQSMPLPSPAGYRPQNMSEWGGSLYPNATPISEAAKPGAARFKVKRLP